ncbi:MAG: T9SS C-terminal target domain-containing protein [Bacteroidetes bacterium]|nr:MAG: T9SS C-terminal target domain-containing protein [Bacteroidota bacterium]REK34192.1 MAG: T9SS C-terminal target domain-containing protein [Bacteroidota bacterium]REK50522.1 MAG: T9SS C-terminal target domain-containing protein [Bacteroidota bacterium]
MKKFLLLILAASCLFIIKSNAQNVITVSGDISSNTTWTNNNIYLLIGFVYVTNNAELTIQEGTIIKGDKATKGSLIITRGSKIWADGSVTRPIVFTSNEPAGLRSYGDWGGLIICGFAPINDPAGEKVIEGGVDASKGLYGGTNPGDNSGILRYVRIEFPGIAFMPNNEINGLTLGGVGSGTIVDYVMVSYSGDDSFECFGGTVNLKHIIAYRGLDDDFDTDFGYNGKNQFLISIRDSNVADISGSNGFESDNDATGSLNNPITYPVYSNVTLIGPMKNAGTVINSNYKRAAHLRRSAKTSIFNSVFSGFPTGLLIDGANTESAATNNQLQFQNNIIAGCTTPLSVSSGSTWDISAWFNQPSYGNSILPSTTDLMLTNPFNYNTPDFTPLTGSPVLNSAAFTSTLLNNPFFDVVTFSGAIGSNDWTQGWTNFDCQNTDYIITSVNSIKNNSNIHVYPNPARSQTTISFNEERTGTFSVKIMDLSGNLVRTFNNETLSKGEQIININLDGVSPGIYTISVSNDSGKFVNRLIIH